MATAGEPTLRELMNALADALDLRPGRRNGEHENGKIIDPTANVTSLVLSEKDHANDIRNMETKWRDKTDALREHFNGIVDEQRKELRLAEQQAIDSRLLAEQRRVDAQRAEDRANILVASTKADLLAANLATGVDTLAKTLATTVDTTAKALAATLDTTAKQLTERIVAGEQRTAALELSRATLSGGVEQKSESKGENRYTLSTVLTVVALVASLVFGGSVFLARIGTPTPTTTDQVCQGVITVTSDVAVCAPK